MNKDNFIIYMVALMSLMNGIVYMLVGIWFVIYAIALGIALAGAVDHTAGGEPLLLWSPFPVRLDGRWTFTYYLVQGSYMVHPEEHLYNQIKG